MPPWKGVHPAWVLAEDPPSYQRSGRFLRLLRVADLCACQVGNHVLWGGQFFKVALFYVKSQTNKQKQSPCLQCFLFLFMLFALRSLFTGESPFMCAESPLGNPGGFKARKSVGIKNLP